MNILLSYSKMHFDPQLPQKNQPYWGSSANILARTLYEILSEIGTVAYIDAADYESINGQAFDLFVGIYTNFEKISGKCKIGKSIFFAVNMHPTKRNQLLRAFSERLQIDNALSGWDLVDEKPILKSLDQTDHILCVGNGAVNNSYIENGIPRSKIKMLNYGVGEPKHDKFRTSKTKKLLYVSSDIGLRKGFDILSAIMVDPSIKEQDFELNIIGRASNEIYQKKITKLEMELGPKLVNHGWIDVHTQKFHQILAEQDFLIYPALEEGQAGAVLDAISRGVIPIITPESGVDFSPVGDLVADFSDDNVKLLLKALKLEAKEVLRLKSKTIEYYKLYHQDFVESFREAIENCLIGFAYPKISVTLPIFNKEKTIIPLLRYFDLAARAYGNIELHLIFDGCVDKTESIVRNFYRRDPGYDITYATTPNIFEIKTNNMGLRQSKGKYCVIIQDDNYVYDENVFYEIATFMDKNPKAAILGCLAGVNYYPRGYRGLTGPGQIASDDNETYWRQDAETDPELATKFFEVDACMRGPLVLRKSFLEEHGYLDEAYVPFYMDDMDIAFRAKSKGYQVYCGLMNVENKSFTIAKYNPERIKFWEATMKRNTDTFYKRWKPTTEKDYMRITRIPIWNDGLQTPDFFPKPRKSSMVKRAKKGLRFIQHIFDSQYCRAQSDFLWKNRMTWIRAQAALVPAGATVLDIGAGSAPYREDFAHTKYVTQDFVQTPALEYSTIDVVSDITKVPLPDNYADVILCTEVFEHVPKPIDALAEITRLLKPGGKLIFSAPLGSGHHQVPFHFYGGYTRFWYEKFFPEAGLRIRSLEPNGGLCGHIVELLWRSHPYVVGGFVEARNPIKRMAGKIIQVLVYNIPTLVLCKFESRQVVEDFTVCFFCIAQKEGK